MRIRPKITLRGFKTGAHGASHVLGELETTVMELFWRTSPQTVNEVEEALRKDREIAHTTVLTTLDRLHRKGYLLREKVGKAFVYAPRYSRDAFERGMVEEVLGALIGQFRAPAISTFVDLIGSDHEKLDQLEEMIRAKRAAQAGEKRTK
ncbi:MAG: BlaI/MecI/CopY family transcriptional regulator [Acidobacteriota bacterium]